jgi:hypothetical protein
MNRKRKRSSRRQEKAKEKKEKQKNRKGPGACARRAFSLSAAHRLHGGTTKFTQRPQGHKEEDTQEI